MKKHEGFSTPRSAGVKLNRRALMKGATALASTSVASLGLVSSAKARPAPRQFDGRSSRIVASPSKNIVETDSGRIFGYSCDGVITFRGIPYGASTDGVRRFMPPSKPVPWPGVRSALYWGPVSPQPITSTFDARRRGWAHDRESFMFEWEDGHDSDDCLRLNVWTGSINDNARRPVMVWLHGAS